MNCPADWFFFMDWQIRQPLVDQTANVLKFRDSLSDEQRETIKKFLLAASVADDVDLRRIDCLEAHNGFFLQPNGRPLREMFQTYLDDFSSEPFKSVPGTN